MEDWQLAGCLHVSAGMQGGYQDLSLKSPEGTVSPAAGSLQDPAPLPYTEQHPRTQAPSCGPHPSYLPTSCNTSQGVRTYAWSRCPLPPVHTWVRVCAGTCVCCVCSVGRRTGVYMSVHVYTLGMWVCLPIKVGVIRKHYRESQSLCRPMISRLVRILVLKIMRHKWGS